MYNRFVAACRAALALAAALACAAPALAHRSEWRRAPTARPDLIAVAARYLGGNPTGWAHNWCAEFLNRFVLRPLGLPEGNPAAASFLRFPHTAARPGAIAVLSWRHRRADHVAIVESVGPDGVHILSGNWSHRVGRGVVRPGSVLAYVDPGGGAGVAAAIPWPIRHLGHRRHHHPRHHHRKARHAHHRHA